MQHSVSARGGGAAETAVRHRGGESGCWQKGPPRRAACIERQGWVGVGVGGWGVKGVQCSGVGLWGGVTRTQ